MASPWIWEQATKRYRNTETGQFVGAKQMAQLRDRFADYQKAQAQEMVSRYVRGELSIEQWRAGMREMVKSSYIDMYVLGKGGRGQMGPADWGRLGAMVKHQYGYLDRFAQQLEAGQAGTEGQARTRAGLYADGAVQSYERGRAQSWGLPRLPAYPGDGTSECLGNCRCQWDIQPAELEGLFACTWTLGAAEHCPTCLERASLWAPLMVAGVML